MTKSAREGRRAFLKFGTGALTGLLTPPTIVPSSALGRSATPPSDRVMVGIIGSGQRAVFEALQYPCFDNVVIVAMSDAVESHQQSAKSTLEQQYDLLQPERPNRGIRTYSDFQELLAQKDIDAVYNVVPDHWHVSMLPRSLKAGKHVHVEKPLGVSVEQDLAAVKAVRKYNKSICRYGAELRALPARSDLRQRSKQNGWSGAGPSQAS